MLVHLFRKYSSKSRLNRARILHDQLKLTEQASILDLGGGTGAHIASIFPGRGNITIADRSARDLAQARERGFRTVQLDDAGRLPFDDAAFDLVAGRLPFDDAAFDLVFCSSVIEHVTGPKHEAVVERCSRRFQEMAARHQAAFAAEIRRVGASYFVQTPYRYFWIESHSWLPGLIVFLPRSALIFLLKHVRRVWPKSTAPDWRLLTHRDMAALFPDAAQLAERSLLATKSLIAFRAAV